MNDHVSSDQRVGDSNSSGRIGIQPSDSGVFGESPSVECPPDSPPLSGYTVTEKRCGRCAETLPASAFNKDRSRACGLQCYCRECSKGNYWRNREKALERSIKFNRENPEKKRAYSKLANEIKYGRMVRGFCEQCGNEKTDAHHWKGYDYPLDVQWLCRSCHVNLEPRRGAA